MRRDPYEVLGVPREADVEAIKRAYRRLAMQHHPDRNPGDTSAEARFKEASEAYEILKDPGKRQAYDRFGHAGGGFAGAEGFDLSDALRAFMRDFGGFGGLGGFEDLFGGDRQRRGPRRGGDIQVRVRVPLEEVATGVEKTLTLSVLEACEACAGTGSATRKRVTCVQCGGAGQMRQTHRSILGQFVNVVACPRCEGAGTVVEKACGTCGGEGRVRREKRVKVRIPAGVSTGNYLTLRGQGNLGPEGGSRGNVVVVVEVPEHGVFERHGDDVVLEHAVSFPQAALGGTVQVPTLDGPAELQVPAGTQPGEVLTLKGKGIPRLSGRGRGDLRVQVRVWVPTKLTVEERRLLEELAAQPNARPPEGARGGFWEKMREVFTSP